MIVGVPKEIKNNEYRVALVPSGAEALVEDGHTVLVETGAGLGTQIEDSEYRDAGATIVSSDREVFAQLRAKFPHARISWEAGRKDQVRCERGFTPVHSPDVQIVHLLNPGHRCQIGANLHHINAVGYPAIPDRRCCACDVRYWSFLHEGYMPVAKEVADVPSAALKTTM